MLHDLKRDIPQLLTAERIAMWLETQPPETEYDYFANCDCLLARCFKDYGYENVFVTDRYVRIDGKQYDFPDGLDYIMWSSTPTERTYGEALKRAKNLCKAELEVV